MKEVNPTNTSYIAIDCNDAHFGMDEILQISYNMGQQDSFEFKLDYGVNIENEINTQTNTIKKEVSATETQLTNDYVMASAVKQEIYICLVFANYLAEKDLVTTCDAKDAVNYSLKVYINGAHREYRWNACDRSIDGVKFTKIVKYIIEQSEQKQTENQEVTVQGYVLKRNDNTLLIGEDLNKFSYELIKDEIQQMDLNAYNIDFIELEGVNSEEFNVGDNIRATIEGP
ncbi:hypothetical protein [Bacillus sp. FSL K6-3431]|uniref:hypothetical protein n=1 Tax=Bacillus sp. FSL K6-3431 TaxID=2921500 RepID=UPI0030F6772D